MGKRRDLARAMARAQSDQLSAGDIHDRAVAMAFHRVANPQLEGHPMPWNEAAAIVSAWNASKIAPMREKAPNTFWRNYVERGQTRESVIGVLPLLPDGCKLADRRK